MTSSPNLLSHFRFGQTRSETKTLQILLESFCVHSHNSCFLLLFLGRLSLLALPHLLETYLRLLWSPPFSVYTHAPIPHFLAKERLSLTLTLSLLTIWYFGQTALFLFLLTKTALAYLPTALSVSLRPLFPIQQAQYA